METNESIISEFMSKWEKIDITIKHTRDRSNVAVIVEPRMHNFLMPVIKNVMFNLGATWNLHIFGSSLNEQYVKSNLPGNYTFTNLDTLSLDSSSYSMLLTSLHFWNCIKEENVLIFQTDSCILNNKYVIPGDFSFIGPSYHYVGEFITQSNERRKYPLNLPIYNFNINGGFSFRKRSAMIACIQNVSIQQIVDFRTSHGLLSHMFVNKSIIPEDMYFTHALIILGYDLPSKEVCDSFAMQQHKNIAAFGVHGFDKTYCDFSACVLKTIFNVN
jgi:hypothetical protein